MAALLPALLFAWGCILVRQTLPNTTPCPTSTTPDAPPPPALGRLAVVVVDGLRWADAATALGAGALALPPGAVWGPARLVAHPPTATLPAVRSMLTGGLPAFVDAGAGVVFVSQAVVEDTWVGRLRRCVRRHHHHAARPPRVVAFGDAAWRALLGGDGALDPGSWSTPALDVGGLDDSRVWASLRREVGRWAAEEEEEAAAAASPPYLSPSPAVAVAHVNALDHAQHARGAASPLAAATLATIATNLTALARTLASPSACVAVGAAAGAAATADTLLLILGDHGSTPGGNHGGASPDETDTAVMAVSVRAWCAGGRAVTASPPHQAVHTVDLAPALALLQGVPPPFSSVGRLPEGLWGLVHGAATYPAALRANAAQVGRYLTAAPWAAARRGRQSGAVRLALSRLEAGERAWAGNDTRRAVRDWEAGLDAAFEAARSDHATLGVGRMGAGLVGLLCVAAHRVRVVVATAQTPAHKPRPRRAIVVVLAPLLLAGAHAASLVSVGALQAEGWVVAGLSAALVAAAGRPTPAWLAATAATWAFLPRAPRTAAEAMHLVGRPAQRQHTVIPWALAAVQAWLVARPGPAPAAVLGVALTLAAHTAFHASGHFPEVAGGLRMDLTAGLPYGLAVAVVAADALAPFVVAGAAARAAGPQAQASAAAARTLTLAGACLSAAAHARHILAPAVFAPRFVFELAFYVSAEVGGWLAA